MDDRQILFSQMTDAERQLFCDYLYKEFYRHKDDMTAILKDLAYAEKHYSITPRRVFVGTRIEVEK